MTTRSLPLLAMGFASLASLAPGRVLAGLGIGSRTVVEDWHGGALPPAVASRASSSRPSGACWQASARRRRRARARARLPPRPAAGRAGPRDARRHEPAHAEAGRRARGRRAAHLVPARGGPCARGGRARGRPRGRTRPWRGRGGGVVLRLRRPATDEARERYRRYVLAYSQQPTHRAAFTRSLTRLDEIDPLWAEGDRRPRLHWSTTRARAPHQPWAPMPSRTVPGS